jgi:hypothetical protein
MRVWAFAAFLLAPQDDMLSIGEKALANAKDLYTRREYFDAISEAERARNIFQALVELYDNNKRKADRDRCADLVKQCNQLIKLANDGRKGSSSSKEPPPPVAVHKPEETPVKETPKVVEPPKPPPTPSHPPVLFEFGKLLSGAIEPTDAVKMSAILRDLKSLSGPWQSYGKVAWTIATRLVDAGWSVAPEDKPTFKEYAEKHLTKSDHRTCALFLAKAAESVEGNVLRWRLFRLLALVHVCEALQSPDSPLKLELLTKGKTLDLIQDDKDRWITREGESIAACKTVDSFKTAAKVKDTIRDVYKAFMLFEALAKSDFDGAKAIYADCKNACGVSEPSASKLLSGIRTILDSKKLCHACGGTHQKKCSMKCDENGMKTLACNRCQGLGYAVFRGRKCDCLAEAPPGRKWETGHTYKVPCPKCDGKKFEDCHLCQAPFSAASIMDGIKTDSCDCCQGSGWLLSDMRLPCYFCFGMGKRYSGLVKK